VLKEIIVQRVWTLLSCILGLFDEISVHEGDNSNTLITVSFVLLHFHIAFDRQLFSAQNWDVQAVRIVCSV